MKNQIRMNNLANYQKYLKLEKKLHTFFEKKNYLKLNLPVLSPNLVPESSIEVFETVLKTHENDQKLYLTPSPELFAKQLISGGVGNSYYLGKAFRNYESIESDLHGVEFEMLEFYKIGVDYMGLADDLLELLQFLADGLELKISLQKWEKITIAEAFLKFAGISEEVLFDQEKFLYEVKKTGYKTENFRYEDLFSQVYTQEIEPNLGVNGLPTIIYDFPKEFASLAKMNKDGKAAQRFEFYITGIELGNCFTELTDYQEQKKRFAKEQDIRARKDMVKYPESLEFLESLEGGLPECSGIAIGFERLVMVLLGLDSIDKLRLITLTT